LERLDHTGLAGICGDLVFLLLSDEDITQYPVFYRSLDTRGDPVGGFKEITGRRVSPREGDYAAYKRPDS